MQAAREVQRCSYSRSRFVRKFNVPCTLLEISSQIATPDFSQRSPARANAFACALARWTQFPLRVSKSCFGAWHQTCFQQTLQSLQPLME